jgi:hypothetical protein
MAKRKNPDQFIHEDHQVFIAENEGKYKFYVKDKEGIWGAFESPRYPRNEQNVFFKRLVNFRNDGNVIEDRMPFYRVVSKNVLEESILNGKYDISLSDETWLLASEPLPDEVLLSMDDETA